MSKVNEDLQAAFAGESQANRKYLAFAKKADEEGFPQVARLFRAAAAAETYHAHSHLRALGAIASTAENLQTAIAGENYEAVSMYPEFMQDAEAEGNKRAFNSFRMALEAEKVHETLYRQALEDLGKEQDEYGYYVCPICGYTHARSAPDKCPICGASGGRFERVD